MLLFLKDIVTPRTLSGNTPPVEHDITEIHSEAQNDESDETQDSPVSNLGSQLENNESVHASQAKSNTSSNITSRKSFKKPPKKIKVSNIEEKFLELEEKKLKYFENNAADDDYLFLMSLLPYLKSVSLSRKLTVRTQLQQVLINEQMSSSGQSPPPSYCQRCNSATSSSVSPHYSMSAAPSPEQMYLLNQSSPSSRCEQYTSATSSSTSANTHYPMPAATIPARLDLQSPTGSHDLPIYYSTFDPTRST